MVGRTGVSIAPMRKRLVLVVRGFVAAALVGCAAYEAPAPRTRATEYHPPPLPGFSITGSVMCSCTACSPRSCCEGAPEDESGCRSGDSGVLCELAVQSCTPRCMRLAWRVPARMNCDTRRPSACCDGS